MWRISLDFIGFVTGVERKTEPLAFFNYCGVSETITGVAFRRSVCFGFGVGEKQVVGNVLIAGCPLLWQIVHPSEQFQNRADHILLGDGFVGIFEADKFLE